MQTSLTFRFCGENTIKYVRWYDICPDRRYMMKDTNFYLQAKENSSIFY